MKKLIAGILVGVLFSSFLVPIILIPVIFQAAEEAIERAAECAVGGAVTGPANLVINGVELGAGLVDGAVDAGGKLIDFGGGLFGIGDDDDGYKWKEGQLQIASTFLSVSLTYQYHPDESKRIGEREQISILAAGLVESELQNVPHGHDSSVGVLQLLAMHGTFEERMNLEFQANWYFDTLLFYLPEPSDRERLEIGEIWATVERPAEEYRYKYQERVEEATALYNALSPSLSGSIAILGDGQSVSGQSEIVDYIEDGGWQTVLFDAQIGRTISDAVPIAEEWQNEYEPSLWVFDLGSSELGKITSVGDATELIELLEEPLPDNANQAWVTIYDETSNGDELFNEALAIRDARTQNFNVVQWSDYVVDHPEVVRNDGQTFTSRGNAQRAALISRVAIDPVSFGFDESKIGLAGGLHSFSLPGACDVGSGILGFAKGAVGAVFNPLSAGQSFTNWVFSQSGIEFTDTEQMLLESEEVGPSQIRPGDLLVFRDDPESDDITTLAFYIGGSEMIQEAEAGEIVVAEEIDWLANFTVHRLDSFDEVDSNIDNVSYDEAVLASGIRVHPSIERNVTRMVDAIAAEEGLTLSGRGWRSIESQCELRKAHCGSTHYAIYEMPPDQCTPQTARPGKSMHQRGLALDLNCNGELITSRSNPCFLWLVANAEQRFGFKNLPSEPWHWSTNGN